MDKKHKEKAEKIKYRGYLVTSLGFVGVLALILVLCIVVPDKELSENEGRSLEEKPVFEFSEVKTGRYMASFEKYAADQIIDRENWVKIKNNVDFMTGKKDNGSVYFGQDGYLFPIEKIDTEQLKKNISYVEHFMDLCGGINPNLEISILTAPTSSEIFSEKVPENAPLPQQENAIAMCVSAFEDKVTDPTDTLKRQKGEYIYYRTDHHWTARGAYYAYRVWAENIGIKPFDMNSFEIKTVSGDFYGTTYSKAAGIRVPADYMESFFSKTIENAKMTTAVKEQTTKFQGLYDEEYLLKKDKYSYFLSGNNPMTVIESDINNGKKLLVIKDSYAHCFVPFLSGHFEEIHMVDLRYYKEPVSEIIKNQEITDVLFLYNIIQFSNDRNFAYLK